MEIKKYKENEIHQEQGGFRTIETKDFSRKPVEKTINLPFVVIDGVVQSLLMP